MDEDETRALTVAIAESGAQIDLSEFGELTVDKDSTGGVGDKTTLIVAPIAAALGCKVAKMSGRGLGHTGGTVDKLESFPGYRTELPGEEFFAQVRDIGIAVVGQSGGLAPADKKLYALRDVTATVDSIPLITSSIMGKKLASGSESIVLDVKCGSGSFMKTAEEARALAKSMTDIGRAAGRRVSAVITNMDLPLGYAVGNSLEVIEAIEVLSGRGPADLRQVCVTLESEMASLCLGYTEKEARAAVEECIKSGAAKAKLCEWIAAQGGDERLVRDPSGFPTAKFSREVVAPVDGFVTRMNAEQIGHSSVKLGAGRVKKGDAIDHSAGIILCKKTGDRVARGEVLAVLYTNGAETLDEAEAALLRAYELGAEKPEPQVPVYDILR
jgi:pyrimidine-nucleoside phosphorylase